MQPLDRTFFGPLKAAYSTEVEKWLVGHHGEQATKKHVAGLFHAAYTRTATIAKAENGFACTGIYPFDPDVFREEDYLPATVRPVAPNDVQEEEDGATEAANNADPTTSAISDGAASQTTVSIVEIDPLPKCTTVRKRSRISKRSEILSGTPMKVALEEKEREKAEKERRKKKGKGGVGARKRLGFEKDAQHPSTSLDRTHDDGGAVCPGCGESFDDDWVQCGQCAQWWHEQCSDYDGTGAYICDTVSAYS